MTHTRTHRVRRAGGLAGLILLLGLGLWLLAQRGDRLYQLSGKSMGTYWSISIDRRHLSPHQRQGLEHIEPWAQNRLDRLEKIFSTWIPNSEINRISRDQDSVDASPAMREVLDLAHKLALHNREFLDFRLQGVLRQYGFELADQRAGGGPAKKPVPGLNLSAIVKGYAVDRISASLADMGYGSTLVELGGEISARCAHGREPWLIAIQHPHRPGRAAPAQVVEICDRSLATSGDYHNTLSIGGQTLSHLIDPATRRPKRNRTRSVTVIGDSASVADAYATAFAVSGLERSDKVFIHAPVRALFLSENEKGKIVSAWKDFYPESND